MKDFFRRFLTHLKFWSFHCTLTALPSFLLAGIVLSYFEDFTTTSAMVLGVVIFVLGYSTLNTFLKPLERKEGQFFKATHLALKVRLFVSVLSVPAVLVMEENEQILQFLPDYYAGWAAGYILLLLGFLDIEQMGFFHTLIWTLLEGLILSFALFMGAFFCLFIVTRRERKKFQKNI